MLRTEKGLTLARVGEGSDNEGNLKGHLSNIEHGRVSLTVMMLERIAKKIDVELPYLTTIPDASERQALIEQTRWMTDDEVRTLLDKLGPAPPRPESGATPPRRRLRHRVSKIRRV